MKGPRWVLEFESRGFFRFLNKKLILMLPLINNDAFVVPCCAALPALLIGLARILGTF